jgi:UPF0042 nucleotide-binding protein
VSRTLTPLPSAVSQPVGPLDPERTHVVVVTGLSGAGKSTALHALEDLGYFCIDNLPTVLAPQAISLCEHGGVRRVALGIDMRVRAFLGEVGTVLATLGDGRDLDVVFFDASDEAILTRFSETRRRHPLDSGSGTNDHTAGVIEGVRVERERLSPLRARATQVVDTTRLSVHDLRRSVIASFGAGGERQRRMATRLVSFGFKYGPPVDADMVLDVRFLQNPYFVPTLKRLPGTDARVIDFVMSQNESREFLDRTLDLLGYLMPRYEREGKSYLTIAIGCTGGMHRSVVIAEEIARRLRALPATVPSVDVAHRDLHRGLSPAPSPLAQQPIDPSFDRPSNSLGHPHPTPERSSSTTMESVPAMRAPEESDV